MYKLCSDLKGKELKFNVYFYRIIGGLSDLSKMFTVWNLKKSRYTEVIKTMNIACFKESSFLIVCLFVPFLCNTFRHISVPIISHLIILGRTLFEYNNKPSNPKNPQTIKLFTAISNKHALHSFGFIQKKYNVCRSVK